MTEHDRPGQKTDHKSVIISHFSPGESALQAANGLTNKAFFHKMRALKLPHNILAWQDIRQGISVSYPGHHLNNYSDAGQVRNHPADNTGCLRDR